LFDSVIEWIDTKWPFNKVAYPGREIDWEEWQKQNENGVQQELKHHAGSLGI